ncbi:MAG: beta-ketoacyl synthase [Chitinophagaceae bacterium]|nr:beta-ketoacyl synthase [Chitinophagaceae bacterium]
MKPVYIIADNITSPIAATSEDNFELLQKNVSGVQEHHQPAFSPVSFYASLFNGDAAFSAAAINSAERYTKFEKLLIASVTDALQLSGIQYNDERTILIVSSTKGNISLLETERRDELLKKRLSLHYSAKLLTGYFHFMQPPVVVSHACISGLVAIITGMRLLQSGKYDHAIVAGADIITKFVLSGFQSFHAVSDAPCKPFDAKRNGINLGEGAATVVLSVQKPAAGPFVQLLGGSVSNDANHISGPSRTGGELYQAISNAMLETGVKKDDVDFISAHGTATVYNDEMEAKAINLAGMKEVPVNSLKGYYGHTLGAAGLIETVACIHSLKQNVLLPTPGYSQPGTTQPVNVIGELKKTEVKTCLKTASGFGGCNAAIILQKN